MSWEYESLFDVKPGQSGTLLGGGWDNDSEWRDMPTEISVGRMGYRTRTTVAGPRLEVEIYPMFGREASGKARAAKIAGNTPEAMKKLNRERAIRYLIRLADANLTDQDIHLTLTYRKAPTEKRVYMDVDNFLRTVKRRREQYGMEPLKYFYTVEGNENGTKERLHAHILMTGGISREELEEIWAKGWANADRLQPDERGMEAIIRYITKDQEKRKWHRSRNLVKPKQRTSDSKVSNAKVKRIAKGFEAEAKEIMEKLYPKYGYVDVDVRLSDSVDGAYIRVLMRRRPGRGKQNDRR